ncbi:MAG: Tim44 domain-containing protein [Magnetococcales bacterium]|nr:Tim44 domain-containing protein [Magnetococcales bacterium]
MNRTVFLALIVTLLAVGLLTATFWPTDAEAGFSGGSSMGSRGSRSFSVPRQAMPAPSSPMRPSAPFPSAPAPHLPSPAMPAPAYSSGLMSGIGGFALGGLLGAALFGGHGGGMGGGMGYASGGMGGGGGIGLLDLLLIGGLIWFAVRWFRQRRERESMSMGMYNDNAPVGMAPPLSGRTAFEPAPYTAGGGPVDEVAQGLATIARMDPGFDEARFLEGAKMAFQHIQGAWSDWSVDRLRPLLTERMWALIQAQALKRKGEGQRDIIEKIHFEQATISEAWQEAGEDWITVYFLVNMVDYTTDVQGKVLSGDPNVSTRVEEYWTFTRPVGSREPGWYLSAIQQPGEVARSVI